MKLYKTPDCRIITTQDLDVICASNETPKVELNVELKDLS